MVNLNMMPQISIIMIIITIANDTNIVNTIVHNITNNSNNKNEHVSATKYTQYSIRVHLPEIFQELDTKKFHKSQQKIANSHYCSYLNLKQQNS